MAAYPLGLRLSFIVRKATAWGKKEFAVMKSSALYDT
jgi:hypothetical protein